MKQIPYYVHEGMMARMERTNRRLLLVLAVEGVTAVIAIFAALKKNAG
ncbi:MAG: hypothetical protein IJX83_04150 [Lachnospiraceae bacterium]|nr:hypothetical protein [Lachnospiraceae bacterium]